MDSTQEQHSHLQLLIEDLRTTQEPQGRGYLRQGTEDASAWCCLGRACEVYRNVTGLGVWQITHNGKWLFATETDPDGVHGVMPLDVTEFFGVGDRNPFVLGSDGDGGSERSAAGMNDGGATFSEIADAFEKTYLRTS